MKVDTKIVMFDQPDLVEYRTDLEGWTGPDKLYHGKGEEGERRARYANSTHKRCECGEPIEKFQSRCSVCRKVQDEEKFNTLPIVEWDGVSWLYDDTESRYFEDVDGIIEHYEHEDIDIEDAQILVCKQELGISYVNLDDLNSDSGTEDEGVMTFYPEIKKKVDELNKMIENTKPRMWYPTNNRIDITKYQ